MALTVTLTGVLFISVAAAQAYTCSGARSATYYNASGVSHVSITVYPTCSDGQMHFSGIIYDDKCDAREGQLALVGDPLDSGFGTFEQWEYGAYAGNGCGTHSSFSGHEAELYSPADLEIGIGACSTTCATWTINDMYF
jgi:hypothetical protein